MWLIWMNISNPCLQLMSFTCVMCLLDCLIMFVFPDDVTDRCLLVTDVETSTDVALYYILETMHCAFSTEMLSSSGFKLYIYSCQINLLSSAALSQTDRNGFFSAVSTLWLQKHVKCDEIKSLFLSFRSLDAMTADSCVKHLGWRTLRAYRWI